MLRRFPKPFNVESPVNLWNECVIGPSSRRRGKHGDRRNVPHVSSQVAETVPVPIFCSFRAPVIRDELTDHFHRIRASCRACPTCFECRVCTPSLPNPEI